MARQRALSIAMIWKTRATGFTSTRWRISNERRTCRFGRRLLLGYARSDTPIRRRDFPRVGYTGGDVANATYRNHGTHAEAIEVIFDPSKISYRKLLEFFFQLHDPTTRNRQGNDVGLSYRSAIFYTSDDQKRVAKDTIADVEASSLWPGKVVTEVSPAGPFWEAEPEHQDYFEKIPTGYTCHFIRPNWKLSVRKERRRRSEGERRGIGRIGRGSPTGSENMCVKSISAPVQVSRAPASRNHPRAPTTGVREAPRYEIAGRKGLGFAAAIYGDLRRTSVCFREAGTTDTLDCDGLICRGERTPPGLG